MRLSARERQCTFDVAAHHAAGVAGVPLIVRELDVVLRPRRAARTASQRGWLRLDRLSRSAAALSAAGLLRRLLRRSARRPGLWPRRRLLFRAFLFDDAQHLADLHVLAVAAVDPREHAGLRRADLDVDLVGLELDERVAGRHALAFLLQPARDARVDDRLADLGHDDIR